MERELRKKIKALRDYAHNRKKTLDPMEHMVEHQRWSGCQEACQSILGFMMDCEEIKDDEKTNP